MEWSETFHWSWVRQGGKMHEFATIRLLTATAPGGGVVSMHL
jgi:hypothetical protein